MQLSEFSTLTQFTAIDFETAHAKLWSICQVGLVRVENGKIVKEIDLLVRPPKNEYHWGNTRVHGISGKVTAHAPTFAEIWPEMEPYISGQHVVAHNAPFDCSCLKASLTYYQLSEPAYQSHCTVKLFKRNLAFLCNAYGIELQHHNALSDAKACAALFQMHLEGKTADMLEHIRSLS